MIIRILTSRDDMRIPRRSTDINDVISLAQKIPDVHAVLQMDGKLFEIHIKQIYING